MRALVAAAIALTAAVWALVSPVGASPDEIWHINYAWGTATGQTLPGRAVEHDGTGGVRSVDITEPASLERMPVLSYRFNEDQPAPAKLADADAEHVKAAGNGLIKTSSRMDRYPIAYYLTIGIVLRLGIAIGLGGLAVLTAARIVSGILSLVLITAALTALRHRFGTPAALIAGSLVLTPMILSLSAAVNANGFEAAVAVIAASCTACVRSDWAAGVRPSGRLARTGLLAALLLAHARPASIIWLLLLFLVLVIPMRGEPPLASLRRLGARWASALGAVALTGLAWFAWANASRGGGANGKDLAGWRAMPAWERGTVILEHFGTMIRTGYTDLGWAEVTMPMLFLVVWLAGSAWGIGALARRPRTAADRPVERPALGAWIVLLGSLAAIAADSDLAGFAWQGRYLLAPLMAAGILAVGTAPRSGSEGAPRGPLAGAAALASASALIAALGAVISVNRYVYGFTSTYVQFADLALPGVRKAGVWTPLVSVGGALALVGAALLTALAVIAVAARRARSRD